MKKLEPLSWTASRLIVCLSGIPSSASRNFGSPWRPGGSFREFVDRLPKILRARPCGMWPRPGFGPGRLAATCSWAWGPPIKVVLSPVAHRSPAAGFDHRGGHERRRHHPRRRSGHGGTDLGGRG